MSALRAFRPGRWRKRPAPQPKPLSDAAYQRLVSIVDAASANLKARTRSPAELAELAEWSRNAGVPEDVLLANGLGCPALILEAA